MRNMFFILLLLACLDTQAQFGSNTFGGQLDPGQIVGGRYANQIASFNSKGVLQGGGKIGNVAWLLGGNTNAAYPTNFVGTTDGSLFGLANKADSAFIEMGLISPIATGVSIAGNNINFISGTGNITYAAVKRNDTSFTVINKFVYKDGNQSAGYVLGCNASGTAHWQAATSFAWSLTGNSGTNPSINFLGTTDLQPLVIKTNGITRDSVTPAGHWLFNGAGDVATYAFLGNSIHLTMNSAGTQMLGVFDTSSSFTAGFGIAQYYRIAFASGVNNLAGLVQNIGGEGDSLPANMGGPGFIARQAGINNFALYAADTNAFFFKAYALDSETNITISPSLFKLYGVNPNKQLFFSSVSGSVIIGPGSADASALLDLESTTTGFLAPQMTTSQRTSIASPKDGLMVYDLTLHAYYHWDSGTSAWVSMN